MSTPKAQPALGAAAGSAEIEAAVLRHLQDIRDVEKRIGGDPMEEWLAEEMAWSRWAAKIPNSELAGLVHHIIDRRVKPRTTLWALLREITIRLSERPKAKRSPRQKRPNDPAHPPPARRTSLKRGRYRRLDAADCSLPWFLLDCASAMNTSSIAIEP